MLSKYQFYFPNPITGVAWMLKIQWLHWQYYDIDVFNIKPCLSGIRHPNIASCLYINRLWLGVTTMVYVWVPGIVIRDLLTNNNWSYYDKVTLMIDILNAVGYLHVRGLVIGDISSANIIISQNDLNIIPVLIDWVNPRYYSASHQNWLCAFHPFYSAPELLESGPTVYTDVFSLGVLMYELFSRSLYLGKFYMDAISTPIRAIIEAAISGVPKGRPTIKYMIAKLLLAIHKGVN